jgi:pilus assembly protein Flp/PilA
MSSTPENANTLSSKPEATETPVETVEQGTDELKHEELDQVSGGATAIQYGLIAATIAETIITAADTLGTNLTKTFTAVSTNLKS